MNKDIFDFGPDAPALENTTWWSPDGKDHFTIRDVLLSDNGFTIRTTDGRVINGDVMERYIQSETPIAPQPQTPPKIDISGLEMDDPSIFVNRENVSSFGTINKPLQQSNNIPTINTPVNSVPDIDKAMIDRVIDTDELLNSVTISINPSQKINSGIITLNAILNVPQKSIKDLLVGRIINNINTNIECALESYLDGILAKDVPSESVNTESDVIGDTE